MDINKPLRSKNMFLNLALLGAAWLVMRILRSPKSDFAERKMTGTK
jgi:hypothetical protein